MILKVSHRRAAQLSAARDRKFGDVQLHDRERRALVGRGYLDPTPADLAKIERAKAKRDRKAAKVARINPVCFGA